MDLNNIKKVHFIGIGGIGISALAQLLHHDGKIVSGTNDILSPNTLDAVRALGIKIAIGSKVDDVAKDADMYVYSTAWDDLTPELMKEVRGWGKPVLTYFQALGLVSENKFTIAVAGTHGKTTTTAMISEMLIAENKDPMVVVGSKLKKQNSNFVPGNGKYFVVEACEYRRSFLNLKPQIGIITNIDNDHLDYYKDLADIQSAFREFSERIPEDGYLICNVNDEKLAPVIKDLKCKVIDYMDFYDKGIEMLVPGKHNRMNAAVTLAVASVVGISPEKARESLKTFSGTWRRFEYKGKTKSGAFVYDDYGHHPTEIRATLQATREKFPDNKLVVVFQPHLYSRTKILLDDFTYSFNLADEVLLLPIYAAREAFDESISSEMLAEKINNQETSDSRVTAKSFKDFEEVEKYLEADLKEGDVVMTVGAGDIYKVGEMCLSSD